MYMIKESVCNANAYMVSVEISNLLSVRTNLFSKLGNMHNYIMKYILR